MKIYVIRHGITPFNKKLIVNGQIDEPLAPEGIEQAEAAIASIPEHIKHIYSSTLNRAQYTAEILNSKLKRPLTLTDALSEIHMGSMAGYRWDEMENGADLKKKHRNATFDFTPFGGESVVDVKKRLLEFFTNIKENHADKEVLIVTHGGIIRMLYWLEHGIVVDKTEKHLKLFEVDIDAILDKHA